MPHETGLIMTIVAGLVLAFVLGAIANRLKLPPLVGYLIAGVLVGPHTPGFVADVDLAPQLAEIGVILLMFGVGLHFSLRDLLSVRAVAIPGAIVQIGAATLLGLGLALLMGWSVGGGLVFGLALSVASTVVLLKALQDRRLVETERGRIAVGWLIVEDLAMVLALVLIPAFAGIFDPAANALAHADPFVSLVERLTGSDIGIWGILAVTIVKLAAFVGFMLVVGRRVIPFILHYTAHTGSRELFRLAVLAIALGMAAGASYLFGVSLALGAFFAGMILSESELSHRAAQESLPLRDAFAVLFFVSVGMLFDPAILIENPWPVIATVFIILVGKSLAAFLIVVAFRRPVSTALTISASLAQIGEFSFILAGLGIALNLLPPEGRDLILAGAIISILLNPLMFWVTDRLRPRLEARMAGAEEPTDPAVPAAEELTAASGPIARETPLRDATDDAPVPTALAGHVILVGYGRVGRVVAEGLAEAGTPFLVVEDADSRVAAARAAGIEVVVGNAASGAILELANVAQAACMLVAIPNAFEAGNAIERARKLNAPLRIVARAHSEEEAERLEHLGADLVIMGEREIGLGMLARLLEDMPAPAPLDEAAAPIEPPPVRLAPGASLIAAALPKAVPADAGEPLPDLALDDGESIGLTPMRPNDALLGDRPLADRARPGERIEPVFGPPPSPVVVAIDPPAAVVLPPTKEDMAAAAEPVADSVDAVFEDADSDPPSDDVPAEAHAAAEPAAGPDPRDNAPVVAAETPETSEMADPPPEVGASAELPVVDPDIAAALAVEAAGSLGLAPLPEVAVSAAVPPSVPAVRIPGSEVPPPAPDDRTASPEVPPAPPVYARLWSGSSPPEPSQTSGANLPDEGIGGSSLPPDGKP